MIKEIELSLEDASAIAREVCTSSYVFGSVMTVRMLADALERLGIKTTTLSTKVLVFNPFVTKEFKPGKNPSKKRLNMLLSHKKGHSIALGMDKASGDGWKGHLVLLIEYKGTWWLVDPTLDQISRPEHNITLMPISMPVDESFGTFDGSRAVFKLNDCAVMYSAFPTDLSYTAVQDWAFETDNNDIANITNQIFERLVS